MRYWLLCLLFIFSACSKKDKIPPDVIGKEKMELVLWDMIQADRFVAQFLLKDSAKRNIREESLILYEKVFQVHKISRDQFVKSYKYYLSRPDITRVIFDSLATRAQRKKEEVYKSIR